MSLGIQERIPERINTSLDPRYTTDYHSDFSQKSWNFDISALEPVEEAVIIDVENLFKSAQRWKAEAVSVSLGAVHGEGYPIPLYSIHIGLHTEEKAPTKRVPFIKPLTLRTHLDLGRVIKDEIGQATKVQYHGSRHDLFIDSNIPQLGPFGSREDFGEAKTPYFIRRIGLHPFYYYKNNQIIAGENPSRVFLVVDLQDGRGTTQNIIDSKLGNHASELLNAEMQAIAYRLRLEALEAVTEQELVGKQQKLLENLNSRIDPFLGRIK